MNLETYRESVVTEEIDGLNYTSSKFSTTKALTLQARVVKALSEPGLRAVILAYAQGLKADTGAMGSILPALVQISYGLLEDPALARDLTSELKCSMLRPGAQPGKVHEHFDAHFMGEIPHLFKVLGFVLTHNLAGFTLGADLLTGSRMFAGTTGENQSSSSSPSEG